MNNINLNTEIINYKNCAILIILIYVFCKYKSLKKKQIAINEALSSVDVQLKKRFDLIPNILTIAKKYMEHESSILTQITELRSQILNSTNSQDKIKYEEELGSLMKNLFVSVENYPELKANTILIDAVKTYNEVEEYISASRRFYNSAITEFKKESEIFPGNLFAKLFNIKVNEDYFKAKEEEKVSVDANKYL